MRTLIAFSLTTFALLALPAAASAQSCLGYPSLSTNHLQVATDLSFGEHNNNIGFLYSYGSESGFGGIGAGSSQLSGGSATTVRGQVGYQVAASASGRTQLCPTLSATLGFGPSNTSGPVTDQQSRRYEVGLALGRELRATGAVRLVPSLQVTVAHQNTSFTSGAPVASRNETDPRVGLSLGIVLNNQLSIRPTISRSMYGDRADAMFGGGIALNFGGRR